MCNLLFFISGAKQHFDYTFFAQSKMSGISNFINNLGHGVKFNYPVRYVHIDNNSPYKYWESDKKCQEHASENYWETKLHEVKRDKCSKLMGDNQYINKELQMDDDIEEHNRNIYLVNTMDENNEVIDSKDNLYNKHSCNIQLTHVDSSGKAKMVDVGEKNDTHRIAIATATICLGQEAFCLLKDNKIKKGDVLTVANIAGIMGAKRTCDFIPLCHNIPLSKINIDFTINEDKYSVVITSEVKSYGKTGVEMEAIIAVSTAAITIYDMCKAVTKSMIISDIKLVHKSGGISGNYTIDV